MLSITDLSILKTSKLQLMKVITHRNQESDWCADFLYFPTASKMRDHMAF